MNRAALLFDLDGTIADSAPGIMTCARAALAEMGLDPRTADDLRWMIGPPLRPTFARLMGSDDRVEEAVATYRRIYAEQGLAVTAAFPGMAEALRRLKGEGHTLFVCTSKITPFAEILVNQFGVRELFTGVYGAEAGRDDPKADLVARIVAAHGLDPARACMIGDRREDVAAGRAHGLATLGVAWGYAIPGELEAAGASAICARPEELVDDIANLIGRAIRSGRT